MRNIEIMALFISAIIPPRMRPDLLKETGLFIFHLNRTIHDCCLRAIRISRQLTDPSQVN